VYLPDRFFFFLLFLSFFFVFSFFSCFLLSIWRAEHTHPTPHMMVVVVVGEREGGRGGGRSGQVDDRRVGPGLVGEVEGNPPREGGRGEREGGGERNKSKYHLTDFGRVLSLPPSLPPYLFSLSTCHR